MMSATPVFIVGMNGSGTTMMLDHLARHPDLYGFMTETYVLPHYLLTEAKYGDLTADGNFLRLWNDMRAEYPFRRRNKGRPVDLPADWVAIHRSAGGVFDRIMLGFAEREGKQRWCEKTPMYALHIERMAEALPAAVFIHMLRDGRDCAASDYRRWGRHPNGTIARWRHVVSEGRRQGGSIKNRYMEVRYENVTERPEPVMRSVCSFVGVSFDPQVLESRGSARNLGQRSKSIVRNPARGTQQFTPARLRSLEKIAGRQLASLGYRADDSSGDREPGRMQKLWWFLHDTRAVITRQLRNKLTVQKRMTWSLYLARVKSTVRRNVSDSTRNIRRSNSRDR